MFISVKKSGYTRHGEQFCQGRFLILMQPDTEDWQKHPIRAIVRYSSFGQCGNFMMGFARVKGHRLTLSGSYGSDGLPKSVPMEIYNQGTIVPENLIEAWNKGGGWNGAGSEAQEMRKWALETFKD